MEQFGTDVLLDLTIEGVAGNSDLNLTTYVDLFKWSAFMNNGYVIYARFIDPNLVNFTTLANSKYLAEARKKPLEVKFRLKYNTSTTGMEKTGTDIRIAYMTNLHAIIPDSTTPAGFFEFIAVDPSSYRLNSGDSSGAAYKGTVSDVITQVVGRYAPEVSVSVSKTNDNKSNIWYQMRMAPKDFIVTLLDWSSSLTNNETNWIVASVDKTLQIKEQSELQSIDYGTYTVNTNYPGIHNCIRWELIAENYLTNIQTAIDTGGISATSGLYVSKENSITKDLSVITDARTSNKKNVELTNEQSFTKPTDILTGYTHVKSVPEDSSGSIGIKYQNYIDGRARQFYISMLYRLLRIKVSVFGNPNLDDGSNLGVSTVTLNMVDSKDEPYWIGGKWLIYGWEHIFDRNRHWRTNLYLSRFDYNSDAQVIRQK